MLKEMNSHGYIYCIDCLPHVQAELDWPIRIKCKQLIIYESVYSQDKGGFVVNISQVKITKY